MMGAMDFASSAPVRFARARLEQAERETGVRADAVLRRDGTLPEQSFFLQKTGSGLLVRAADDEGAMNALLDLADSLSVHGRPQMDEGLHRPYIPCRGIKLNVPLDARTPSYTDCGDSAQCNIPFMWDEAFWQGFLDRMALNRYNTLTLWNLCPFPSMVRVPEYPNAALDDVMVSAAMTGGTSRALEFYTPEMKENLVCVRRMTMDQKAAFWRRVFRYAADRCIRVYIFTWNLYLYGLEDSGYPLTERADDPETRRYIRCSAAALLRAYPTLKGIGVTAGENLCAEWTERQDMRWVRETYGRAVEDVLAEDPERDLTLICRTHMTTLPQLREAFATFRGKMELSTKYAMAHMTAADRPRFSDALIAAKPEGTGLWLTLRQDDFYLFPWADDLFLESLMAKLPTKDLRGYYFGADGVIWGVENQSRSPEAKDRYWFDKHFYAFALMGRLGYKAGLSDGEKRMILRRYVPGLPDGALLEKYRHASRAVRLVSLTHWRNYDFQWYPEACCFLNEPDRLTVFDDLNRFVRCGACPDSGAASVLETARGADQGRLSALENADTMLREADLADAVALPEGKTYAERELRADLTRVTALARYYARKLRGAVFLARALKREAAEELRLARTQWDLYADETARWYRPQRLSRLRGVVSPDMWHTRAERDLMICLDKEESHVCNHQ